MNKTFSAFKELTIHRELLPSWCRQRQGTGMVRGDTPVLHPARSAWELWGRRWFPDWVTGRLPSPSPCGVLPSLCFFVVL